ncbi:TRAP transporter small permease [Halalkalibacter krulwichiae]|uniref:2,3-diketo-L-gulonate TRAP transporter small permease protein YiaM n=1 Tax=Halalkalibacter krulwichiae TaxID=199441 RepID=A0A1X9MFS2_9BACI|nr:TRAP transporter small permease [Halalkalibacter krulwichiae]ARK32305.1 2,3-diketo-L-gulonate TRAP transporter small permease protein YiaM [Halalkalibacter krulwichiae]
MKLANRISSAIDKICQHVITILLVTVSVVLFIQVFSRFVLNSGTFWTDELARYATVWLVFLGAAIATRDKSLMSVDIFESLFPKSKRYLRIFQTVMMLIYAGLIAKISYGTLTLVKNQLSPNMSVPMTVLYAVLPLSALIMVIHLVVHLLPTKSGQGDDQT